MLLLLLAEFERKQHILIPPDVRKVASATSLRVLYAGRVNHWSKGGVLLKWISRMKMAKSKDQGFKPPDPTATDAARPETPASKPGSPNVADVVLDAVSKSKSQNLSADNSKSPLDAGVVKPRSADTSPRGVKPRSAEATPRGGVKPRSAESAAKPAADAKGDKTSVGRPDVSTTPTTTTKDVKSPSLPPIDRPLLRKSVIGKQLFSKRARNHRQLPRLAKPTSYQPHVRTSLQLQHARQRHSVIQNMRNLSELTVTSGQHTCVSFILVHFVRSMTIVLG